jgi:predicted peptidase
MENSRHFSGIVTKHVALDYLWFQPPRVGERDYWPLVLFLHGAGERGQDVGLIRRHGLPRITQERSDWPFLACSPQCPPGETWVSQADAVMALLDELLATEPIDPTRVYLTGLSLGGEGTWYLGATHPERFAALVPICGRSFPDRAPALAKAAVPIWVFHGTDDAVVPVTATETMVEKLKKAGGKVRMTLYPGVGHDSWTQTYENPEVFEWLLAQRRQLP